jgi:hypothetical protein
MSFEKFENSPTLEHQPNFSELREKSHKEMDRAAKERAEKNPKPTDHELHIGDYEEVIEPQMRPILKELYKKGYTTESSGFGGIDHPEIQQIDGYFEIDPATEEKLKELGAWVTRQHHEYPDSILTRVEFRAEEPDIDKIIEKWTEIAGILPKIGEESYSTSAPSHEFRTKHLGEEEARRILIETSFERGLVPKDEKEQAEQWLKEHPRKTVDAPENNK